MGIQIGYPSLCNLHVMQQARNEVTFAEIRPPSGLDRAEISFCVSQGAEWPSHSGTQGVRAVAQRVHMQFR
jgi:hypothetical protein